MKRRSGVNVKVEPRLTFTFTRGLLYIASFSVYARKFYVRSPGIVKRRKINQPLRLRAAFLHCLHFIYALKMNVRTKVIVKHQSAPCIR